MIVSVTKKKIFPVALCAVVLLLTSCGKNDSIADGNTGGSISATIVSGPFGYETRRDWSISSPKGIIHSSGLTITAIVDSSKEVLRLDVPNFIPGDYISLGIEGSGGSSLYSPPTRFDNFITGTKPESAHRVTITKFDFSNYTVNGYFWLGLYPSVIIQGGFFGFEDGSFENVPVDIDLEFGLNESSLTANIDGVEFNPEFFTSTVSFDRITLAAVNPDAPEILEITIPKFLSAGLHNIGSGRMKYTSPEKSYTSDSGILTIESHDLDAGLLTATFWFEGVNWSSNESVSVTEGTVTIDYQSEYSTD